MKPLYPFYPDIEPYRADYLAVSATHKLYFEECGNPQGKPVVFLHGGPGGGISPKHRTFFNPQKYRIILFDQRGCGHSIPHASLIDNTTWHLVADMEQLRSFLGIDKWQVFGGSWGSTLALAYAEQYPHRVTELILRGIFTFTQRECDWFYKDGTSRLFPEAWDEFIQLIPEPERDDLVAAYYKRLCSPEKSIQFAAARAWSRWESQVAMLIPSPDLVQHCEDLAFALAFARIECHYFINHGFLHHDSQLIDQLESIRHLPTVIVHGRYDAICPLENAWNVYRKLKNAQFIVVPDAGHSAFEAGIATALVEATDRFSS